MTDSPAPQGGGGRPKAGVADTYELHVILRWLSSLFGIACLCDCATEAFTGGRWHSYTEFYQAYLGLLALYTGASELKKWHSVAGSQEEDARLGAAFVVAWFLLIFLIFALNFCNEPVVWPPQLVQTAFGVATVFVLGAGSGWIRTFRFAKNGGDSGGGPDPVDPTPGPSPDPQRQSAFKAVVNACKARRDFRAQNIVDDTGLPMSEVAGILGWLVKDGKIKKDDSGIFHWIGGD